MNKKNKILSLVVLGMALISLTSCEPYDRHEPYYGEEVKTFREDAFYTTEVWAASERGYHYLIFGLEAEYREDDYSNEFVYVRFDADDDRDPSAQVYNLLNVDDALYEVERANYNTYGYDFEYELRPTVYEGQYLWMSYSADGRDLLLIEKNDKYIRANDIEFWGDISYEFISKYSVWVYQEYDTYAWYFELEPRTRSGELVIKTSKKMKIEEARAQGLFKKKSAVNEHHRK